MRWAILAVVCVLGLASEAAAQGPTMTVNLDGNSQVLPLTSTIEIFGSGRPPGSRSYHYTKIVGGNLWQLNVGSGLRLDEMQFRVMKVSPVIHFGGIPYSVVIDPLSTPPTRGIIIGPRASSPFIPATGGSGFMQDHSDGGKGPFANLPVSITP